MKIYLAGTVALAKREKKNSSLYRHRLFSFFYIFLGQIDSRVFELVRSLIRKGKDENIAGGNSRRGMGQKREKIK